MCCRSHEGRSLPQFSTAKYLSAFALRRGEGGVGQRRKTIKQKDPEAGQVTQASQEGGQSLAVGDD